MLSLNFLKLPRTSRLCAPGLGCNSRTPAPYEWILRQQRCLLLESQRSQKGTNPASLRPISVSSGLVEKAAVASCLCHLKQPATRRHEHEREPADYLRRLARKAGPRLLRQHTPPQLLILCRSHPKLWQIRGRPQAPTDASISSLPMPRSISGGTQTPNQRERESGVPATGLLVAAAET